MIKKKLILWGATGQALVLEEFILDQGFELFAIYDENSNLKSPFIGVPIFSNQNLFFDFLRGIKVYFLVAIGGNNGIIRLGIISQLLEMQFIPVTAIHPSAYIAKSSIIGIGSQILMGACVGAKVSLGKGVIVNTVASVDHECFIEDGVHIGPGARLAGCVTVEKNTFIGTGAVVLPRVHIGSNVTIGAGAVVTRDVKPNTTMVGNPAKVLIHKEN